MASPIHGEIIRHGDAAVGGREHGFSPNTHPFQQLQVGATYNVTISWSHTGATSKDSTGKQDIYVGSCIFLTNVPQQLTEIGMNKFPNVPPVTSGTTQCTFTASEPQESLLVELNVIVGEWIKVTYDVTISPVIQTPSPATFSGDANQHKGSHEDGWYKPYDDTPPYVQTFDNLIAGVTYAVQLNLSWLGGKYTGPPGGPDTMGGASGDYMAFLNIKLDDTVVVHDYTFLAYMGNKGQKDMGVTKFVPKGSQAKLVVQNNCSTGWFYAHISGNIKTACD